MSNAVSAWCSWCFARTDHELVEQKYLRRNLYQCSACLKRTLFCRFCDAMARGHDDWDDELCAMHDRRVQEWGQEPRDVLQHGRCSWCFEESEHRLQQTNVARRDVSECSRCLRRTLRCVRCKAAFARGHGTYDDKRCAKCDGSITSWKDAAENKLNFSRCGWCSWCFHHGVHTLEQKHPLGRDVYSCDACLARTLQCRKCVAGMARGGVGWDDEQCASCAHDVDSWEGTAERVKQVFAEQADREHVVRELSRWSEERQRALESGMLRPFLFLVSMDTATRNQVASALGWTNYTQEYFGDAHKEAWDIIHADAKGIQARTNESWETLSPFASNCNWYETVYRVGKAIFKKLDAKDLSYGDSIKMCKTTKNAQLFALEDEFLEKMTRLHMKQMSDAEVVRLDELMEADEVRELAKEMKKAGIHSAALVRSAVNMTHQAIRMGGFNTYKLTVKVAAAMNRTLGTKIQMQVATKSMARFASTLNVVGWLWLAVDVLNMTFGSSHSRLFSAVVQVLNQKLFLAAEGISVDDFYETGGAGEA